MKLRYLLALALIVPACVIESETHDPSDNGKPGGGSDDPGDMGKPSTCASFSGTWVLAGSCGFDTCVVTQVGCTISSVTCEEGGSSNSGSLSGSMFTYNGTTANGDPTTCSGNVSGDRATGSCVTYGVACQFSGDRL